MEVAGVARGRVIGAGRGFEPLRPFACLKGSGTLTRLEELPLGAGLSNIGEGRSVVLFGGLALSLVAAGGAWGHALAAGGILFP